MSSIYVDVELGDFDTDDIISELEFRLDRLDKKEKEQLNALFLKFKTQHTGEKYDFNPPAVEVWKSNVFREHAHKKTLQEIEAFFHA